MTAQTSPSDSDLARSAAGGDRESFALLYDRYFDRIYDFGRRMLRDPDEAADLTQDTFLRAVEALPRLRQPEKFRPWLFSIAHNQAMDRLAKATPRLPDRDTAEDAGVYDQVDPDRLSDPSAALEDQETAALVWSSAAALEPSQYEVLDLHVRQGLDSSEIAQALGISRASAYVTLNRLKKALERAVTASLIASRGRRDCDALDRALAGLQLEPLTPRARRVIEQHVARCPVCGLTRKRLASPLAVLGAFAFVPAPAGLRRSLLERLPAPASGDGATPGAPAAAGTTPAPERFGRSLLVATGGLGLIAMGIAIRVLLSDAGPAPRDPDDVRSTSHLPGQPSTLNEVAIAWSAQRDAGAYSLLWSTAAADLPDTRPELPGSATSTRSPTLAPGDWYFHLRTQARGGGWTNTVHAGPFRILEAGARPPPGSTDNLEAQTPAPAGGEATPATVMPESPSPPGQPTIAAPAPSRTPTRTPTATRTATPPRASATRAAGPAFSPSATSAPEPSATPPVGATPTAAATATASPSAPPLPRPDFVILGFQLVQVGQCSPNSLVYRFEVIVGNAGNAPSPSPANPPRLLVSDDHDGRWRGSAAIGPLQPGAEQKLSIDIPYFQEAPQHIAAGAPHPFRARADADNRVQEASEANNAALLSVAAPPNCP